MITISLICWFICETCLSLCNNWKLLHKYLSICETCLSLCNNWKHLQKSLSIARALPFLEQWLIFAWHSLTVKWIHWLLKRTINGYFLIILHQKMFKMLKNVNMLLIFFRMSSHHQSQDFSALKNQNSALFFHAHFLIKNKADLEIF